LSSNQKIKERIIALEMGSFSEFWFAQKCRNWRRIRKEVLQLWTASTTAITNTFFGCYCMVSSRRSRM